MYIYIYIYIYGFLGGLPPPRHIYSLHRSLKTPWPSLVGTENSWAGGLLPCAATARS